MCQIYAMNSSRRRSFCANLKCFCKRGGGTDIHAHGFGLAIYQGNGLQSFHDTQAAVQSPIAKFLQDCSITTYNMMAHVRFATTGGINLANVHPFARELWGIHWSFCHNGQIAKYDHCRPQQDQPCLGKASPVDTQYIPVGDTDSEAVFCAILNALKAEFDTLPTLPVLHSFLSRICKEIITDDEDSTIFNFLLGCGEYTMFAYSWPGRRPGSEVWNGLHYIIRDEPLSSTANERIDHQHQNCSQQHQQQLQQQKNQQLGNDQQHRDDDRNGHNNNGSSSSSSNNNASLSQHTSDVSNRVAVVATEPVTDEDGWVEFKRGELLMFDKGMPYRTPRCCEVLQKQGHGLYSRRFQQALVSS